MSMEVTRARNALFAFFLLHGVAVASWVTRTPALRNNIRASIAEMGMVLFGISIGSMTGILLAGRITAALGTRQTARLGMVLAILGLAIVALGSAVGLKIVVASGLAVLGFALGMSEIAVNVAGAAVEREAGRPVMHLMHGFFSLGTVCGAVVGMAMAALAVPPTLHLGAVALLTVLPLLHYGKDIPEVPLDPPAATAQQGASVWRDRRVLLIGVIVLGMALAEGAANDWLPLLMVDEYGFDQAVGSSVFLAFAAAMTLGRFIGGWFLLRFGRMAVVQGSALLAALGLVLVTTGHHPAIAGTSVLLWGIGASLGFPLAISAAGDGEGDATARVKAVAIMGYVAFLAGPPLLGFLGEHFGLRRALLVVLGLILLAFLSAPAVRSGRR